MEKPTEAVNWKNFDNGVRQHYRVSKNTPADWLKWSKNLGETIQHKYPVFEPNIYQPETNFEVYEDETEGKAHEIPEVNGIMYLELFLNSEVLLTHNG